MERFRMDVRIVIALIASLLSFPAGRAGAETVTFSGSVTQIACPAVCGVCCGSHLLTEMNGGFTAHVQYNAVALDPFDDGQDHRFTGSFSLGPGSCGQGEGCVYFLVDSVDAPTPAEAVLEPADGSLRLPLVNVKGFGKYEAVLAPPYNVTDARVIPGPSGVPQFGDCSGTGAMCEAGTFCLSYFGIAGGAGPLFSTCEIPCTSAGDCPQDQHCVTVADGPGQVCVR